jgi:hypothetical protein
MKVGMGNVKERRERIRTFIRDLQTEAVITTLPTINGL